MILCGYVGIDEQEIAKPIAELLVCINRTQGKSVHARAFALERLQSPVSYVGIDIVSCKILKIMYRTISKSTFDDESR